jgi:hypothetical protein
LQQAPNEESLGNTTAFLIPGTKSVSHFCTNCGCNVFFHHGSDGRWLACAGITEIKGENKADGPQARKSVSKIGYHEFVGDTSDGGIAVHLTKVGGRDVPCYGEDPDVSGAERLQPDELDKLLAETDTAAASRGKFLEASCRCGSCRLRIASPIYKDSDEGWYLPKHDRNKYYARFCCCQSCRLTLGFSLQPWAYIPPSQIQTSDGSPVIFGLETGKAGQFDKLKHYQSSDTVLRSFCGECGATIFYQSFERPYVVDVSVGVLRSKVGNAMVGEWLEWDRNVVSKRDEAVDEDLVEAWLNS